MISNAQVIKHWMILRIKIPIHHIWWAWIIEVIRVKIRMNEFLEQLVRDLTNAYSRSQKCLVSVYHLAPQISEAFSVFLVAGEQKLLKQQLLIHLNCLCSVSIPISVFFTHSLLVVLRGGQGTISKRRS